MEESKAKSLSESLLCNTEDWQEGKKTAGTHSAKVKQNMQLDKESETATKASQYVINLIQKDQLLKSFCLPKHIHGLMFSKTSKGDGYGAHVDNAYMSSGRSDLSFTLFLTCPQMYEGGELSIQALQETKEIKLHAGQIIIYPSTALHSVRTVTKGKRVACVGWIHSYIASNEDRNILFGLDAGAKGLLANYGQSNELDLIFQSYNNLLRRLGS